MTLATATAPDADAIRALAQAAVDSLPETFRAAALAVTLHVTDFASDEVCEDLGIDDPFDLTGLYDGTPLPERSVAEQALRPDAVWLFRRPILDEWAERGDVTLGDLVAHVTIHEFAHHFGWSDDDIAAIDHWWK